MGLDGWVRAGRAVLGLSDGIVCGGWWGWIGIGRCRDEVMG